MLFQFRRDSNLKQVPAKRNLRCILCLLDGHSVRISSVGAMAKYTMRTTTMSAYFYIWCYLHMIDAFTSHVGVSCVFALQAWTRMNKLPPQGSGGFLRLNSGIKTVFSPHQ